MNQLKQAHELKHMDNLEKCSKELTNAWANASEEIYQANQTAQKQEGGSSDADQQPHEANADQEDVTDAEFEEVKDDKK